MGEWRLHPPVDLRAWELDVDDDTFVVFEWNAPDLSTPSNLTEADADVLRGILAGESNVVIARRRRTNPRTVANQVAALFRKLGVHSRAELVARMVRRDADE